MKRFTIRCEEWTKVHVRFSLFDPARRQLRAGHASR